jgi:predicted Zn-dependent protease
MFDSTLSCMSDSHRKRSYPLSPNPTPPANNPVRFLYKILILLISSCSFAVAAPFEFREENFAVEIPSDWQILNPPPAQVVVAAQKSNRSKTVLFRAVKNTEGALSETIRDAIAGTKKGSTDQGWRIANEGEASIDKLPFHVIVTRISATASMVTYVGGAGNYLYFLQGICKNGDANTDPDVQVVLNSFRLLSPAQQVEAARPRSVGYRIGYIATEVAFVVIVAAAIWRSRRRRG